jgi:ABC-2 type transport system permease protein
MLYLGTGIILWQFIAANLNEGATVLISGREMLLNARIEPLTLVLRLVARNALTLVHNIPVYILLVAYAHPGGWSAALYAIPAIVALGANVLWMTTVVAIGGLRFRDVPPIIASLTQILFLLTPIIWRPDSVSGTRGQFTQLNPLTHILGAVREPLIGHPVPQGALAISIAFAILGLAIATLLYSACARRLHYWF